MKFNMNRRNIYMRTSVFKCLLALVFMGMSVYAVRSQNVVFTKEFIGSGVTGGTVDLEFTITNNESSPITGLAFTDDLDAALSGLVATGLPLGDICRSGSQISGTSLLTFTGGGVPGGGSCNFTVTLQIPSGASPGNYSNTTSQLSGSFGGNPFIINGASDNLVIESGPSFSKSFNPAAITLGGSSTLTFTIDNSAGSLAATALDFTDNLPAGIIISNPSNTSTTCTGGTLTATAGNGTISYNGGSVAAGSTCTISVEIQSISNGMHQNTTGDLTSSLGNSGTATSTITVAPSQPIFEIEFIPNQIMKGGISTLTYTITNPNGSIDFNALGFVDDLPPGLAIATAPNASTSCSGAAVTASAGGNTITFSNGALNAMSTCTVQVDVTSTVSGLYQNDAELSAGRDPIPAMANLGVDPELDITLEDSISFDPSMDMIANPNDSIMYTLNIENTGDTSVFNLEIDRGSDPNITLDPGTIKATPVAINDEYQLMGSPFNIPMGMGLLTNDADVNDPLPNPPFNTNLTVTEVQGGAPGSPQTTENGGTVTVNSDGSFVYDSTGVAMATADSFFYQIIDSEGFEDSARVIVFWTRPPMAQNDDLIATVNIINNYGAGTLFNDNGNGADDLGIPAGSLVSYGGGSAPGTVTTNAAGSTVAFTGGMLTVNGDGSFTLSNPTTSGVFTFLYRIQNTIGFSDATVTITIQGPPNGQDDTDATVLAGTSSPGSTDFHIAMNASSNGVINVYDDHGSGADVLGLPSAPTDPPADVIGDVMLAGMADAGTGTIGGGSFVIGGTGSIEITTAGLLNLTPPTGFVGLIEFDYTLANSVGTDASPATVTIAVGNRPVAMADAYDATGNIPINTTNMAGNDLLANDSGDGILVTSVQGSAVNVGMATATTNGGSVVVQANGEFVYTPLTGFTGNDTYTYRAGNGFGNSSQVTVTITVSDLIYFMDDAAAAGGDGSLSKPYQTIAEHNGAPPSANSYLFIKDNGNTYSGNLTLVTGQTVIGEGTTGTLFGGGSLTGITLAPLSNTVSYSTTGNTIDWAQIINNGGSAVTFNSGNTITGLYIGNRMTYAFTDNGSSVGSLSVKESEVTGTGGGLKIENGGTLDISLNSLNTSGGSYGIWLKNTTGTMAVTGGTITNPTVSAITLNGGSVSATFTSSSISQSVNTTTVIVDGGHSGVLTYSGTINTTNGNGLQFNNADGQYNFNNTVALNGGDAGIDILNGSGGSFTFSNTTITNPSGTALSISNSSPSVSYLGGGITQMNANSAINITNNSSGIFTLNIPVTASTSTANAVNITGNSNTINMTGANVDVDLTTTSGIAFNATGGGTVNLGGASNTITKSGNSNALNINGTNTSSGINFMQINVTGGTGTAVNIQNSTGTKSLGDVDVARGGGGSGIIADNAGTINSTAGSINSGNQNGIDINNTTLGMTLTSVTAGGTHGIDLTNILASSTFTVTGTTTVNSATGNSINLVNLATGGNFQFGTTDIVNRGTTGVFIDNALGTIGFGTTTDANGSSSTGYGIRVEDSGAAVTFAATNISNTVVGTLGTYNSVTSRPTSDGDGDAIFLKNNTGSFTTNGGTIQDIADNAVDIRNSDNTTISGVDIQDGPDLNTWSTTNAVIQMYLSDNLTFLTSSMSNIGDDMPISTGMPGVNIHDVGMRIYDCGGDLIITNSIFNTATGFVSGVAVNDSQDRAVELDNDTGTDMNVTVKGSSFTGFDFQGLNLRHIGGSLDAIIGGPNMSDGNTFTDINGASVNTGPANAAATGNTHGLLVQNNTFTNIGIAVEVFSGRGGTIGTHATIKDNTVNGTYGDAFALAGFSNGMVGNDAILRGLVTDNSVMNLGGSGGSAGAAFWMSSEDGADVEVRVSNNTQVTGMANGNYPEALRTQNRGGDLDVIVENNSFSNFPDNFFGAVFCGNSPVANTRTTIKFDNNTYQNVIGLSANSHGFDNIAPAVMEVEGYTGTTTAQMNTHLNNIENEIPAGSLVSSFFGNAPTNGTASVTAPMSVPLTP